MANPRCQKEHGCKNRIQSGNKKFCRVHSTKRVNMISNTNPKFLLNNGFVVIPCLDQNDLKNYRSKIDNMLMNMPEFKPHQKVLSRYVMGGFSALGNPGSFHNMIMRELRERAHVRCFEEVFNHFLKTDKNLKFEQVIDRFMFRPRGASPSAESWHRDESLFAEDSDTIFGGWLNLDDEDQIFSCVPGTHRDTSKNKGFAKISNKSDIENFNKTKKQVQIPPGHVLVFYERMVHEVVSKKKKFDMYRLFLGWRLTYSDKSLIDNLDVLLKNQAIIPIKSGQLPPMYSKMHWNFPKQRDALEKFSMAFKDSILTQRIVKQGNDKGRIYKVVPLHMKSLNEMGLRLYPNYTKLELDMYFPASLEKTQDIIARIKNKGQGNGSNVGSGSGSGSTLKRQRSVIEISSDEEDDVIIEISDDSDDSDSVPAPRRRRVNTISKNPLKRNNDAPNPNDFVQRKKKSVQINTPEDNKPIDPVIRRNLAEKRLKYYSSSSKSGAGGGGGGVNNTAIGGRRCHGVTRNGTRCKHSARNNRSKYCARHAKKK